MSAKLENRKTSPCSPCAPNLLHVLVSRILGYHKLCSPVSSIKKYLVLVAINTRIQLGQVFIFVCLFVTCLPSLMNIYPILSECLYICFFVCLLFPVSVHPIIADYLFPPVSAFALAECLARITSKM